MRPSQTAVQQRSASEVDKENAENDKKLALADVGIISGVGAGGLVLLIVLSFWLAVGRVPFIVGATLPLFTLLAIVYQAIVYRRQWHSMEQARQQTEKVIEKMQGQIDASDKALRASQRAYIGLEKEPELNLYLGRNPEIEVFFVNTGRTPAYVPEFTYKFSSDKEGFSGNFIEYQGVKKDFTIFAGTPKRVHCVWNNCPVNGEWLDRIVARDSKIFFAGRLVYKDVYGTRNFDSEKISFKYFSLGVDKMREAYTGDKDYDEPDFIVELDGTEEAYSEPYPGDEEPPDYEPYDPYAI